MVLRLFLLVGGLWGGLARAQQSSPGQEPTSELSSLVYNLAYNLDGYVMGTLLSPAEAEGLGLMSWLDVLNLDPCGIPTCCDASSWGWDVVPDSEWTCAWEGVCCDRSRVVAVDLSCREGRCVAPLQRVPPGLADLTSLRALNISYHGMSGALPRVADYSNGYWLDGGVLPISLEMIDASHNSFDGSLGSGGWRAMTRLRFVDLSSNALSDVLPGSWGRLYALEELRLDDNSLEGNIPESWMNLSPNRDIDGMYDGSLRLLNLAGNCGMCGKNVPMPAGTTVVTDGTSLGSDCSAFNCGTNLLPNIMIGLGSACLLLAVCIIGRYAVRRCGPQGMHLTGGPQSRVHADPHWESVFGGDPMRGYAHGRGFLPPPLLVAHIDAQEEGVPLISSTRVFSCSNEAQLRELKLLLADEAALNTPSAQACGGLIRAAHDTEHRVELQGLLTPPSRPFGGSVASQQTPTYSTSPPPTSPGPATPEGSSGAAAAWSHQPSSSPSSPSALGTPGAGGSPSLISTPATAAYSNHTQSPLSTLTVAHMRAGELELGQVRGLAPAVPEGEALGGPSGSTTGLQDSSAEGQQLSPDGSPSSTPGQVQMDGTAWRPGMAAPPMAVTLPFAGLVLQPSLDEVWLAQPDGYADAQAALTAAMTATVEAAQWAAGSSATGPGAPVSLSRLLSWRSSTPVPLHPFAAGIAPAVAQPTTPLQPPEAPTLPGGVEEPAAGLHPAPSPAGLAPASRHNTSSPTTSQLLPLAAGSTAAGMDGTSPVQLPSLGHRSGSARVSAAGGPPTSSSARRALILSPSSGNRHAAAAPLN